MPSDVLHPVIKILLFSANPKASARLRIDREFREIRSALQAEQKEGKVVIEQRSAGRPEDLQDALLQLEPHIVHFSGHGTEKEEILLEESGGEARRIGKEPFARLFAILKGKIRLVILNACHSKSIAEAVGEHIAYVVGTEEALADSAAVDFSVAFYKAIAAQRSVESAFDLGRNALHLKGVDDPHVPALITQPVVEAEPVTERHSGPGLIRLPVQVLFLLDLTLDNPVARDEVEAHMPDQRSERHVLFLSKYGVRPVLRGVGTDFSACADAVARMVADARQRLLPDGPPVRYYVAGRGALPVFTHLGMELSPWADVTLINQRKSLVWDVLSFQGAPKALGEPFFKVVKGLDLEEPSEADGRVVVFISTGEVARRAELQSFLRAHNSYTGGFVEVRAGQSQRATLDATNAAEAMSELTQIFERIPNAFPRRKGIALSVAGPATLAFMAGRAISLHSFQDVWALNRAEDAYEFGAVLPWKRRVRTQVSDGTHEELTRRKLLESIVEHIHVLQRTLRVEHLTGVLSADDASRFMRRLSALWFDKQLEGNDVQLKIVEQTMVIGSGFIEALRTLPEGERVRVGQRLVLRELFRFIRSAQSPTYGGVVLTGVALDEVDYWLDAMTVATLSAWEIHRGGEAGKERAREIVAGHMETVLLGLEAFDRFEQGERLDVLTERRLRRYLTWNLQRARAQTMTSAAELAVLLGERLVVDLAPLEGRLNEHFEKVVDVPRDGAALVAVLGGKLVWSRMPAHSPSKILDAFRRYDRKVVGEAMRACREEHAAILVPWAH